MNEKGKSSDPNLCSDLTNEEKSFIPKVKTEPKEEAVKVTKSQPEYTGTEFGYI